MCMKQVFFRVFSSPDHKVVKGELLGSPDVRRPASSVVRRVSCVNNCFVNTLEATFFAQPS